MLVEKSRIFNLLLPGQVLIAFYTSNISPMLSSSEEWLNKYNTKNYRQQYFSKGLCNLQDRSLIAVLRRGMIIPSKLVIKM